MLLKSTLDNYLLERNRLGWRENSEPWQVALRNYMCVLWRAPGLVTAGGYGPDLLLHSGTSPCIAHQDCRELALQTVLANQEAAWCPRTS